MTRPRQEFNGTVQAVAARDSHHFNQVFALLFFSGQRPEAHSHAPPVAYPQLEWLLAEGGFTERELVPALKREILQWDERSKRLVCFMGWVRWLVAAMVLTFALGFALAGWAVIVLGEHSLTWAAVTAMCSVFSVGALYWLQAFVYGPWRVAVRAARKLRGEGF